MSAYVMLNTPMIETEHLVGALQDVGFAWDVIEVHEEAVQLKGYRGDRRDQRAHVVIRRKAVGSTSNDLGFLRTDTGYRAVISSYDQGRYNAAWLERLGRAYDHRLEERRRLDAKRSEAASQRHAREDRRRLVEAQKRLLREKAKSMGYSVTEKQVEGKTRLVLVKRCF